MSESIRVDVARACDLAEVGRYLTACGFTAMHVHAEGGAALDVTDATSTHNRLDVDVWNALTAWLATTDRPLVPRRVAEREYALTPPGE